MAGQKELNMEERSMQENSGNKRAGIFRILIAAAAVCSAAALILYWTNGTNKLSPDLLPACIGALAVSAVLGILLTVVGMVKRSVPVLLVYVQYLAALVGFAEYIVSQLNYIANVFYGVDGNSFTIVMIATAVAALLGWVLSLTAAVGIRRMNYRYQPVQEGE